MLILEPRGHVGMYGAILRPSTELVSAGEADMGVLFLTNEGYSTMCGHASIALGRFLVDCHDETVFPRREMLEYDQATRTVKVRLHAPCGLVVLTVPTTDSGRTSDPSRPVSFLSVPSFASGLDVKIPIPPHLRWPELQGDSVAMNIAYGGAFYALVRASDLGLPNVFANLATQLTTVSEATKRLKQTIVNDANARKLIEHPEHDDLSFLYSVLVVDDSVDIKASGSELGLCFFGDQQIDRSPTGSAVAARVAAAHAKGERDIGRSWTYDSIVSRAMGKGHFTGTPEATTVLKMRAGEELGAVVVKVEGYAFYTGFHEFVREEGDSIESGFLLERLVGS